MRLLLLGAAALLPGMSVAAPVEQVRAVPEPLQELGLRSDCLNAAPFHAVRPGEPLRPKKLAELPPGNAYHAAFRIGPDGCPDPLPVGHQYRRTR